MTIYSDLVACIKEALREWKRARWRRQRLADIRKDPSLPF